MVVSGWAADLTVRGSPASLVLILDGHLIASFSCELPRPDLHAFGIPGDRLGFRFELPEAAADGVKRRMSVRFRSGEALTYKSDDSEDPEIWVRHLPTAVTGHVDGMHGAAVRGWAFRTHPNRSERTGGVVLEVRSGGAVIGQVKADQHRVDVSSAHGCDPHCGFQYFVPPRLRDGNPFLLEFTALPEETPIGGSPFSGNVLGSGNVDHLQRIYGQMEALATQVFALKFQMQSLLTKDEPLMEEYDGWARAYGAALRARVMTERRGPRYAKLMAGNPKVSVICPAYKPSVEDFTAAVVSVRRQTWENWELIIVDDGSKSPMLTRAIEAFCAADPRIRAVPHARNQGISAATNTGIAAASGEWVALFDHDDLLADVALEVMLLAAGNTGARALYSDEDKVDRAGIRSEPHLKTDWNPRLLLGNNYVCHLFMARAEVLRELGPLRAKYDGAQDHDLMLRMAELLPSAPSITCPKSCTTGARRRVRRRRRNRRRAMPSAPDAGPCRTT